jgi:hypothetical protein
LIPASVLFSVVSFYAQKPLIMSTLLPGGAEKSDTLLNVLFPYTARLSQGGTCFACQPPDMSTLSPQRVDMEKRWNTLDFPLNPATGNDSPSFCVSFYTASFLRPKIPKNDEGMVSPSSPNFLAYPPEIRSLSQLVPPGST